MTNKKAIEIIKEFDKHIIPCDEYGYRIDSDLMEAHSMAVNALSNAWIPVSERLPDVGKRVLCSGPNGGIFIAGTRYCAGRVLWDDRTRIGRRNVTHWMPLPEPPKED